MKRAYLITICSSRLKLHALGDTFSNTVQKARKFSATTEVPRTRKSLRITTPPAHEALQLIQDDPSLHKRMNKLEDMIRSLQVTSRANTPLPSASTVTYVTDRLRRQFPSSRPKGEVRGNDQGQTKTTAEDNLFNRLMRKLISRDRRHRQRQVHPLVDTVSLPDCAIQTRTW